MDTQALISSPEWTCIPAWWCLVVGEEGRSDLAQGCGWGQPGFAEDMLSLASCVTRGVLAGALSLTLQRGPTSPPLCPGLWNWLQTPLRGPGGTFVSASLGVRKPNSWALGPRPAPSRVWM